MYKPRRSSTDLVHCRPLAFSKHQYEEAWQNPDCCIEISSPALHGMSRDDSWDEGNKVLLRFEPSVSLE